MQLLNICFAYLLLLRIFVAGQTGRDAFQITDGSKSFVSASDIFTFRAQSYIGDPWNLNIASGNACAF